MGNRVIQAKILKEKKRRRLLPRRMGGYNPVSDYAMRVRKFDPPDSTVMERDVSQSISPFADASNDGPKEFNSLELAKAHLKAKPLAFKPAMDNAKGSVKTRLDQRRREDPKIRDKQFARPEFYSPKENANLTSRDLITAEALLESSAAVSGWQTWNRQGKTLYVRMNCVDRRDYQLDMWFYQQNVYFIEHDLRKMIGRRSMNYRTISRARLELNHNSIRWVEELPIEASS